MYYIFDAEQYINHCPALLKFDLRIEDLVLHVLVVYVLVTTVSLVSLILFLRKNQSFRTLRMVYALEKVERCYELAFSLSIRPFKF